jgi:hypothetical protein
MLLVKEVYGRTLSNYTDESSANSWPFVFLSKVFIQGVTPIASLAPLTCDTRSKPPHFTTAMKRLERNPVADRSQRSLTRVSKRAYNVLLLTTEIYRLAS